MTLLQLIRQITGEDGKRYNKGFMFHSPLRDDNNTSFSVTTDESRFYDFGTGEHGDIIDFVRLYRHCDYNNALKYLSGEIDKKPRTNTEKTHTEISWTLGEITDVRLIDYATKRAVKENILKKYAKQATCGRLTYVAIENTLGGINCRNGLKNGKKCYGKMSYTYTEGKNKDVVFVFEGMFDMLSFLSIGEVDGSIIVLNSTVNTATAINVIQNYKLVHCYLDNDHAGDEATRLIQSRCVNVVDHRENYIDYNDVNDFILNCLWNR